MQQLNAGAIKLGLRLSSRQREQFQSYYEALIDWNKRMNLTRITDYQEVQIKHFLDSLTVTLAWPLRKPNARFIDVGAGAGFPGIPIKILLPDLRLVLLDATAKRANFLYHLTSKLGLDNVDIVVGRAEEIAHQPLYREAFDIVLSRAVAPLATLVELTLPFCAIGGSFIAHKKGAIGQEISQASQAIELLGGKLREVKRVALAEFTGERELVIVDKISLTPKRYPRRPGMPAKRPLILGI
ncbi:MAG: 16S rRNA (guanine(527)-N(7))-methyltransferase RsmG [Dehalococcoidales bacterium]|nr:16S rRNA (guanine(527)-N(7))-methyltransferase RsmG [Dehalococcoidales bacterium]